MDLEEWTTEFVKHKNMHRRRLKDVKKEGNVLKFDFDDGEQRYVLMENLEDVDFDFKVTVVCLHDEENFSYLLDNWEKFAEDPDISFVFVNIPENRKWQIRPYIHNRIADPDNLEDGLRTSFEEVR